MIIKVWLRTNKVGSKIEREFDIDDDELASYEDEESRLGYIDKIVQEDILHELYEWGWEKV